MLLEGKRSPSKKKLQKRREISNGTTKFLDLIDVFLFRSVDRKSRVVCV